VLQALGEAIDSGSVSFADGALNIHLNMDIKIKS
jgi:hypothetical protein